VKLSGCRVALRPRGPLEVLDLAVRLGQEAAGPLVALAGIVLLPAWLVASAIAVAWDEGVAVAAVLIGVAPVLQLPFLLLGARVLFERDARARDALSDLRGRGGAVLLGLLRTLVVVVASLASLGLFWLPVQTVLMFVLECSALERVGTVEAVRRSARLASDQVGRTLAGALVQVVVLAWCALAGELCGQVLVAFVLQAGTPFGSLADGVVTPWVLGGILAAQPLLATYRLLLYLDVRTVLEGWDLQVALMAAAEEA
jgi:hypothetical protein